LPVDGATGEDKISYRYWTGVVVVSVPGAAEDGINVGFCGDEDLKRDVDAGCHRKEEEEGDEGYGSGRLARLAGEVEEKGTGEGGSSSPPAVLSSEDGRAMLWS
jgi:hypothetical protein